MSGVLGTATEAVAERTSPAIGGLLNATMGNFAELIIAAMALRAGHPDPGRVATQRMSYQVAALLISGYGFSLPYSLRAHSPAFLTDEADPKVTVAPHWSSKQALTIPVASAVAIGVVSEILVSVTEEAVKVMGLSEFFVGLILVPIIGNAAEHSSAILMAMKNRMDLAINVAVGSSIQVALLIGPLLVFLGVVRAANGSGVHPNGGREHRALRGGGHFRDEGRGIKLARRTFPASCACGYSE